MKLRVATIASVALVLVPALASAEPGITIDLGGDSDNQLGAALRMILTITAIALAPAMLLAMTSFLRIVVAFSFLRSALGVQGMPPQPVLSGLALFITVALMAPIGSQVYESGLAPSWTGR